MSASSTWSIREPSGRAGSPLTPRAPRRVQSRAPQHLLPRQSLDDSEEVNDVATIVERGMRTPTSAMSRWLGNLPSPQELGPNEHFAIAEYDDENGYRRSAMFVYESVDEQPQATNDSQNWLHPRTPPLPPTVPTAAFDPHEYANAQLTQDSAEAEAPRISSFRITALNSVETGKIIFKRFAKTAGRAIEKAAVMPDYNPPGYFSSLRSGPQISRPVLKEEKKLAFATISLQEAQAKEQARRAEFQARKAAPKPPLERKQIGHPDRMTDFGAFIDYRTPPEENDEEPPLPTQSSFPPRIPDRINRPARKPVPTQPAMAVDLNKSLPPSPDTDSLRRRTQVLLVATGAERPDVEAGPEMKAVLKHHRTAVVSHYGLVFGDTNAEINESEEEEKVSWPGTPANFDDMPKQKPMWWQFEASSSEEIDPTQVVWAKMEDSLRNGGGIRKA